jgi:3-deoxy-7-phosphoheptulonate synthase
VKLYPEGANRKKQLMLGKNVAIGDNKFLIIAGPCAVEGEEQLTEIAKFISKTNNIVLRGGVYKPRTSPHDFQGMGLEGAKLLSRIGKQYDLPVITEITDSRQIEFLDQLVDIYQIGSRNMYNYDLLKEVGKTDKPVLLKRGMAATIKEWLLAASYIELNGNNKIILCERGIRTFETYTRNTLDLSAVVAIKYISHYPIVVDPSHATGRKEMIIPLAKAALIAGADGVMVEVHNDPKQALCDGQQSLNLDEYGKLVSELEFLTKIMKDYE